MIVNPFNQMATLPEEIFDQAFKEVDEVYKNLENIKALVEHKEVLAEFLTKMEEINKMIAEYVPTTQLQSYYTKGEIDTLLAKKADKE